MKAAQTSSRRARARLEAPGRKMRAFRDGMRAAGMRQVQIWVPDASAKAVQREARRQSRLASSSPAESEALELIEGAADLSGWR